MKFSILFINNIRCHNLFRHLIPKLTCAVIAMLLLTSLLGFGQGNRPLPAQKKLTRVQESTPVEEHKQLSPQKMEEALRMLLKADSVASIHQRARLGPESSGLVVDQTITKIGHDFYDQFYSKWEAPNEVSEFTIVIGEKPSRGNNAIVTVKVNDEDLLEIPLQGKYDIIDNASQQAVGLAASSLIQANALSRQLEQGNKQPLEVY